MDCERFEATMMDLLYGELDELTGAGAQRHAASCARCAALIGGLRATRRLVALPPVALPPGLEDRILAAAHAAPATTLRRRTAHAVSWLGSWAMRPQTAMAAVFLVMIGTSVLLLRGKASRPTPTMAAVTITEQGRPAPEPSPTATVS